MIKQRIHGQDERNLRTGRSDDINWLIREMDRLTQAGTSQAFLRFLESGPQPAVLQLLASQIIESAATGPKKMRTPLKAVSIMVVLLKAVSEVLHAALQAPRPPV